MKNDGELTEDEVFKSLSILGQSATGLQHTYLSLSVPVSDPHTQLYLFLCYCGISIDLFLYWFNVFYPLNKKLTQTLCILHMY